MLQKGSNVRSYTSVFIIELIKYMNFINHFYLDYRFDYKGPIFRYKTLQEFENTRKLYMMYRLIDKQTFLSLSFSNITNHQSNNFNKITTYFSNCFVLFVQLQQ